MIALRGIACADMDGKQKHPACDMRIAGRMYLHRGGCFSLAWKAFSSRLDTTAAKSVSLMPMRAGTAMSYCRGIAA